MAGKKRKKFSFKRIILFIAGSLLGILATLFLILYIQRDELANILKETINNQITGEVDFNAVGLSVKHFPQLGLCFGGVKLTGGGAFEGDTIALIEAVDLGFDIRTMISRTKQPRITNLTISNPNIWLKVTDIGDANYDLAIPSEEETEPAAGASSMIAFDSYSILNGTLSYTDESSDILLKMEGIQHIGSGELGSEKFILKTQTESESLFYSLNEIPYLENIAVDLDLDLDANNTLGLYQFSSGQLLLNSMGLNIDGEYDLQKSSYTLKFSTPENTFKNLLSILPGAHSKDFDQLKADGQFSLDGNISSIDTLFPQFNISLKVTEASFKYPQAPLGVSNINFTSFINNEGQSADNITIDIPTYSIRLDGESFSGKFSLKTPISDPDFDFLTKGKINLDKIQKAYPIEDIEHLTGIIDADVKAKGKLSQIQMGDYASLDIKGKLSGQNIKFKAKGNEAFKCNSFDMMATPKDQSIEAVAITFGESNFDFEATLKDVFQFYYGDSPLNGKIKISGSSLDGRNSSSSEIETNSENPPLEDNPYSKYLNKLNLDIELAVDTILLDQYTLHRTSSGLKLNGDKLLLQSFTSTIGKSDLKLNGNLTNLSDYLNGIGTLTGNLNLTSSSFDVNDFMEEEDPSSISQKDSVKFQYAAVPRDLDLKIDARMNSLHVQGLDMNNVTSTIRIHDGIATLQNTKGEGLGGTLSFDGTYDSRLPEEPFFSIDYNLKGLSFSKAAKSFYTFPKLAPIVNYIEGKFNSTLHFDSRLGKAYFPKLSSVNANGVIETLDGFVKDFPPFEKVASFFKLEGMKSLPLQNTKNLFEVLDGRVLVRPFDVEKNGIKMNISGSHGLEADMDYTIFLNIPSNKINENIWANKAFGDLKKQASTLGLNLDKALNLDFLVTLGGTILKPKIEVKLLGDSQSSLIEDTKKLVKAKIDSVKKDAVEKVDSIKKEVENELNLQKEKAIAEIDKQIAKIERETKITTDSIRSASIKLSAQFKEEGYKTADKLVKEAGDDPLKKFAAETAAKKLKKETDKKAEDILSKGQKTAELVENKSRERIDKLKAKKEELQTL